jgi:predicted nucleotide-binding protein (sugar kinase/HSP70/actin superfamily)
VRILTSGRWFAAARSAPGPRRSELRVGIPRTLNIWSTHRFWLGFLAALGFDPRKVVFSGDTSEEQGREYGRGRGTVDCCYPVKCMSGHYGELLFGQKRKIDILLSPMIRSLPSFLHGQVVDSLACPRVMAAPENIKAGFLKEKDVFAEQGVKYLAPFVSLAEPAIVPKQLHGALKDAIPGLTLAETQKAVAAGYAALDAFNRQMRGKGREILEWCAANDRPCILVLARPYHMDPGIGHEIEADLQAYGYPILWAQYFPTDPDLMDWLFGDDVRSGKLSSPFDIKDVWPSSYSANTNEILWGAKAAARVPWISGVIRFASYECGMDQPTYTPVQRIVESSGTLFFSFQDLDATKPAGSVKIRVETIAYYLQRASAGIIERKKRQIGRPGPVLAKGAEGGATAPTQREAAVRVQA